MTKSLMWLSFGSIVIAMFCVLSCSSNKIMNEGRIGFGAIKCTVPDSGATTFVVMYATPDDKEIPDSLIPTYSAYFDRDLSRDSPADASGNAIFCRLPEGFYFSSYIPPHRGDIRFSGTPQTWTKIKVLKNRLAIVHLLYGFGDRGDRGPTPEWPEQYDTVIPCK